MYTFTILCHQVKVEVFFMLPFKYEKELVTEIFISRYKITFYFYRLSSLACQIWNVHC